MCLPPELRVCLPPRRSTAPTPFCGYSFHVVEAVIVFANEVLVCFLFPIHMGLHRVYHIFTTIIHEGARIELVCMYRLLLQCWCACIASCCSVGVCIQIASCPVPFEFVLFGLWRNGHGPEGLVLERSKLRSDAKGTPSPACCLPNLAAG